MTLFFALVLSVLFLRIDKGGSLRPKPNTYKEMYYEYGDLGSWKNLFHGGGMNIFWNYTINDSVVGIVFPI